jgi:GNAT superfamily N-acetyltransferase
MEVRVATADDLDGVTATLTAAFASDPLWGWAFPEVEALATWWRFLVSSAMRYPWVWIADECAAASVWIPPGGVELTDEEEGTVEALVAGLVGPRGPEVLRLLERFEESHPTEREHYYLSLLGTHPESRGRGLGMALLADNLELIDQHGACAYLESSNPDNDPRYERHGFRRIGSFERPDGGLTVSTMWRDPKVAG